MKMNEILQDTTEELTYVKDKFLPTRLVILVFYCFLVILSLVCLYRVPPRSRTASWYRSFFSLISIGSIFRIARLILAFVVTGTPGFWIYHSIYVIIDFTPAFIFFTTFTILLFLWLQQWALSIKLIGSSQSFKTIFLFFTSIFYAVVTGLLIAEAIHDHAQMSSAGIDVEDTIFQIILHWLTTVMYLVITIGFLLWGFIIFKRSKNSQNQINNNYYPVASDKERLDSGIFTQENGIVSTIPDEIIDEEYDETDDEASPINASDSFPPPSTLSSLWDPSERIRSLGILSLFCVFLFTIRMIVLVLDRFYGTRHPFIDPWFELLYYLSFEIAPFVAMCFVLTKRPRRHPSRMFRRPSKLCPTYTSPQDRLTQ